MATDYEKLGVFYLGREYDPAANALKDDLVLYDSQDLTTHAVCVGMTGSGKTGLCLSLLEEAAIDGVPAICIDPKGDLGNLLLTFPNLAPADFEPWIDAGDAQRKGLSAAELAAKTAENWKKGLAEWGQEPARIAKLRAAADVAIYTPGAETGLPLSVLRSFAPPTAVGRGAAPCGAAPVVDASALRDRVSSMVSGLLSLLGIEADPIGSREHILLANLVEGAWRQGLSLDVAALIQAVQKPPFDKLGAFDLETFFPAKDRLKLAMQLNNLIASPGFATWMSGEPLDAQRLLFTAEGKPRISIISIAHLNDAERMFVVTLVLNELITWMRAQSGTSSLRAIFYMDEIFGYFPPSANPASKPPMLTLLKQARAFGLGCVLATQNPVDLDYKGLSNCGTWFIGRLQTERDKLRVIEGLKSAQAASDDTNLRSADVQPDATRVPDAQRARRRAGAHEDALGLVLPARPADRFRDRARHGRSQDGPGRFERARAGHRGHTGRERPPAGGRRNRRVFPDRLAGQRTHSLQTHDRRLRQAAFRRCEAGAGCLGNFRLAGAPGRWRRQCLLGGRDQRFAAEGAPHQRTARKARNSPRSPAAHCAPPVIPAGQKPCRRVSTRPRVRASWSAMPSRSRRSRASPKATFARAWRWRCARSATPRWPSCAGSGRPNYCSSPTRSGGPRTGMRASRRSSPNKRCRPR